MDILGAVKYRFHMISLEKIGISWWHSGTSHHPNSTEVQSEERIPVWAIFHGYVK